MKLIIPDSFSDLLRATHVLVIRIESARAGAWVEVDTGVSRPVDVEFTLEEVAKGTVSKPAGTRGKAGLRQYGTGTSRVAGVPGAWSRHEVAPGKRFVVLAISSADDPAALIADPACFRVVEAALALTDVHLARQIEAGPPDLASAVALARPQAAALGSLFADYLWARFADVALFDPARFDTLASLLEEPKLGYEARAALIARLTVGLTTPDRPPEAQLARYALALFRLLALPDAAPFHDNIIDTDLPTVLHLADPGARTPRQVFSRDPNERPRALQTLRSYKGTASASALLRWLGP